MLVAEEFLLLCLDEETGRSRLGRDRLEPALAGAMLAELALRQRVTVTPDEEGWSKRRRLTLLSAAPTGDAELDRALTAAAGAEGRRVKDLLATTSSRRISRGLRQRLLERLVDQGVLQQQTRKLLGLIPDTTWPPADFRPGHEVRQRLHGALVVGLTPDDRTTALVGLLWATGMATKVLDAEDRATVRRRAKEHSHASWVATAIKQAIDEAGSAGAA